MSTATVNVRYLVDDFDAAISWYTGHLGFCSFLIRHRRLQM